MAVVGLTGRYSLDALRAIVVHQTHKLTTYSFEQTIQTVRRHHSAWPARD